MEKSNKKTIRKFNTRMQARLLLVFCVITLCLMGLIGRLIYITQTDGERYAKQVLSRQSYVSAIIPYRRGEILDRNGAILARSELQYKLILDPKRILSDDDYYEPTVKALMEKFNIEKDTIDSILQNRPNSQYVIMQKNLTYDVVNDFKLHMKDDKNIQGVWFEGEYVRYYPYETLASDIIGFTSADNTGYWGIEEYYNEELNGTNGREYGYYDSTLNIDRIVKQPEHGNSIISTIDANIQRIVQKHIKEFNEEIGSKNIGVIVMNPNNGEIIAMASNQEYDLNNPRDLTVLYSQDEIDRMTEEEKLEALYRLWKNDIISESYEPGSTFKPFTIAAGLEEALISDSSTFICDGGEHIGGHKIRCSNRVGHGELTLAQSLMRSCNDALMHIAELQGRDIFYKYQTSFGFGEKTGIDLPGETTGILISLNNLNKTELATSSFGQSFTVSMLQLASAYSSAVNGGYLYKPHVVKQIINDKGATVKTIDKTLIRQTISEQTSKLIQEYLYQTVEAGTAKWAQVEGYAIGGKTGTAQKIPRSEKKYIVSFIGSVPAINPEVVFLVVIDEAENVVRQDDSSIATKFASKVLKEILPALGIYPEGPIDYLLPGLEDYENQDSIDELDFNVLDDEDEVQTETEDGEVQADEDEEEDQAETE
ncbi:MAG: peptidoglycan glycosyltransferase [Clostridiales bacterium]|nr:peptidoglycan glycosyltransferase [Clostridiales bacterium]